MESSVLPLQMKVMMHGPPSFQSRVAFSSIQSSPQNVQHLLCSINYIVWFVYHVFEEYIQSSDNQWQDSIRKGYWAVHDAATEGRQLKDEDLPFMISPAHIRHCTDLIRQSLVCQPDTTVEIKDKKIGGVTGFGTMHQCRDWEELIAWTTKWQAYNQDPRQGDNGTTHHHHHHQRHHS